MAAGDIIIFRHENKLMVKRIAAAGGQSIIICKKTYTVPFDCYFVLGDNQCNSYDSRYWSDPYVRHNEIIAKYGR